MKRPNSYTGAVLSETPPRESPTPGPGGPIRSRRWERRPKNKTFSYRVGSDVDDLLTQAVEDMAEQGWICTKSEMARAWLMAGYELWYEGEVDVEGFVRQAGSSKRKTDG